MASTVTAFASAPNAKYFSKLSNSRVLVVGGSTGMGRAVAEAAIEHGAITIISSSNETKLATVIDDIGKKFPDRKDFITSHVCDLSKKDQLESNTEKLLAYASTAGPEGRDNGPNGVDHVVITAGDSIQPTPLSDISVEHLQPLHVVRQYGSLLLAKQCLKYMKKTPSSSFTLTGGLLATKPMPGFVSFAMVNAGLEGIKNGLTVDMKPIRVNLVSPGAVPNESWKEMGMDIMVEQFKRNTVTGTLGTPEDMAEAYLYFMKDKFVTGMTINTNGGALFV